MNSLVLFIDHSLLSLLDRHVAERTETRKLDHVRHVQAAWNARRFEVGMVYSAFPHCEQTITCVMSKCGDAPAGIPSITSVNKLIFAK